MKNKRQDFDFEKATQALVYFANKEAESSINRMKAIKLVWAADRYHLRKYGRLLTNDIYVAMKLGPVASNVKNIAERDSYIDPEGLAYIDRYMEKVNQYVNKAKVRPDMSVFSDTEVEALEFAHKRFGKLDRFDFSAATHNYPEWSRFKDKFEAKATSIEQIDYLDFFKDPDSTETNDFAESRADLELAKQVFAEESEITALWN